MLGWLITFGVSGLIGGAEGVATLFVLLGAAVFFPRLTKVLFATVVFPVYTLVLGVWLFIGGWALSIIPATWDSFTDALALAAIPVAAFTVWAAAGVATLARD